jgi:hypothetical protein
MVTFEMDATEASWLATTLNCLADLINPAGGTGRLTLTDAQFQLMTDPAAIKWDRGDFAQKLQTIADRLEGELPPGAPQVSARRRR